jgi:3-oxoacid CoA-transferase subunit B/acetate CoA/acetoacetate CoA-transferase beta subunit
MDLVNGARQVIVTMELTAKGGEKKILKECTYPLTGARCVTHIVTEQCVIDISSEGLVLREILEGLTPEDIQMQVEPRLIIPHQIEILTA